MVLKCADIGHLAADIKTHKRWAFQLEEEFFRQVCYATNTSLCMMFCNNDITLQGLVQQFAALHHAVQWVCHSA